MLESSEMSCKRSLKVLEFQNSQPRYVKNGAAIGEYKQYIVNVSVTYWLDAVKAVLHTKNFGGTGLEKGCEGA